MDIQCEKCRKTINIPDNKVPKGKSFNIGCPHCKHKNKVPAEATLKKNESAEENPPQQDVSAGSQDESAQGKGDDDKYGGSESAFMFLEEGARTALVCEMEQSNRTAIVNALKKMDYHVFEPNSPRDALKQMRFHDYDVIVINEMFGTRDPDMNHVLKYLEQLNMSVRRNIFVTILTDRFQTMDNMATFNKSVNLIINSENMKEFDKILTKGISDYIAFYKVYKESLKKVGKA